MHALVSERERGASLLMRQQGLAPGAAAAAAAAWFGLVYGAYMAVFVGFGAAVRLNVFIKTGAGVQVGWGVVGVGGRRRGVGRW